MKKIYQVIGKKWDVDEDVFYVVRTFESRMDAKHLINKHTQYLQEKNDGNLNIESGLFINEFEVIAADDAEWFINFNFDEIE